MKNFKFRNDWFTKNCEGLWPSVFGLAFGIDDFSSKPMSVLEIGPYEGRSTVWIIENVLGNEGSSIISVDPFMFDEHSAPGGADPESVFETLVHNVKQTGREEKFSLVRMMSDDFFPVCDYEFDMVFVDGCHEPRNVFRDINNSWRHLRPGGLLIADDYMWNPDGWEGRLPRDVMDEFLDGKDFRFVLKSYQLFVQKKR